MRFKTSIAQPLLFAALALGSSITPSLQAATWMETSWFRDPTGASLLPDEYDLHSGPQKKWMSDFIKKIDLKGDEDVLDAGSGTGYQSALIASRVPKGRVIGIDTSEKMVQYAMATYGSKYKNLVFQRAHIKDIVYERFFDVAISSSMFHWFTDNQEAINHVAKALKPKGRLYLKAYTTERNNGGMNKAIEAVVSKAKWKLLFNNLSTVFPVMTPADIEAVVKNAGLTVRNVQIVESKYTFKNREELINWLMPWKKAMQTLPVVIDLPEKAYRSFVNEIVTAYLEAHPALKDGSISFTTTTVEIEAEKPAK